MTKQLIEKLKKTIRELSFDSDDSHRPYPIDVIAVSVIEDILKAYDKELRDKVEVNDDLTTEYIPEEDDNK